MIDKYTSEECSKIIEYLQCALEVIDLAEGIIRADPNRGYSGGIINNPWTGLKCATNRVCDVMHSIENEHYYALKREGKL